MKNQDEIIYIKKHFSSFLDANKFTLKASKDTEIIFENQCAELLFSYELRFRLLFEDLYYVNKANNNRYLIGDLIEFLNPDLSFNEIVKSYTGEYADLKMTTIQAYSNILPKYLGEIISNCNFSWEKAFNEDQDKKNKW